MDQLAALRVFVKAVDLGSFAAAANALQTSPQLIGKQVRMLEQHLGIRLLNRTTRKQSVTDVGGAYYERAKLILAEIEAADGLAVSSHAVPRGRLRVNAPVTFGTHTLAPRLSDYMRAFPEVSVDLSLSNRFVDMIEEGYDVVFRTGDLPDSGLIARPLAPYRLVLSAAPAYLAKAPPLAVPGDLRAHECLGFMYGAQRAQWTFDGAEGLVSVPVSERLRVDNGQVLLAAALAGLGLILQPLDLVDEALKSGRLTKVLPEYPVPVRPLHMLYAPDRMITPKLRSFLDFSTANFGPRATSPSGDTMAT